MQSSRSLEVLLAQVRDAVLLFDVDGYFVTATPAGKDWLGEKGSAQAAFHIDALMDAPPFDLKRLLEPLSSVPAEVRVTGSRLSWAALQPYQQGGETFFVLRIQDPAMSSDEAENKIASLARFPSENPNPVLRVMPNGDVLYRNEAAEMFFARRDSVSVPDEWLAHLAAVHGSNEPHTFMVTRKHRTFALSVAPVPGFPYLNIYGRDETDRLAAEARVHQSLQEKTLLLEEIHHRVKNNLQIVISMLSLQREHLRSKEAVSVMEQSANRIRVMANLHQKVYEHDDLTNIELRDYLNETLIQIHDFFRETHPNVRLVCDIDSGSAGIEQALLVGQLLNELMTNSLKHAFPLGRAGCIEVRVRLSERGRVSSILYKDDGIGMSSVKSEGLGSRLIELLARQLQLSAERVPHAVGTCFEFGPFERRLPSSPRGRGAVLIVEDELLIAESRKLVLEAQGLSPCHVVASAEDALAFIEAASQPPSVIVTDINLGDGMTGLQLIAQLEALHDRLGFVVVSGYTRAQHASATDALRSDVVWLDKNVGNQQFVEAIRAVQAST